MLRGIEPTVGIRLAAFTAEENVSLPLDLGGVSALDARRRALDSLTLVGVAHRRNHVPSALSGGEQQRVAIARALAIRPAILLADEPTGNLDSATGEQVLDLFARLHGEGKTVLALIADGILVIIGFATKHGLKVAGVEPAPWQGLIAFFVVFAAVFLARRFWPHKRAKA